MKSIRKLVMFALTAFLLIGSLRVMAIERPSPVNGQGVTTLSSMEQATYSVPM
jgi:hypothetical protein